MKRIWMMMALLMWAALGTARAQDGDLERAMRSLGAATEEETDPDYLERLEGFRMHPLRINGSRARLLSSGLLTSYQVASIEDYRSRSGDILSPAELSLVDGFSTSWVETFRPYLSFASDRMPGSVDTVRVQQHLQLRATTSTYGGKYKIAGNRFQAGGAWRRGGGSFHGVIERGRSRLLIGDYQVRFGQGAAHWSGFSMTGLSTLQAFSRRATGLTPVWSYASSGTHRGLALETGFRRISGALFADVNGFAGGHLEWMFRSGSLGGAAYWENRSLVLSADFRTNFRGADLFGEVAWKRGVAAGKGGVLIPLGEHFRTACQLRALPSRFTGKKYGEYALATGLDYLLRGRHSASWTVDASFLPIPGADPRRIQLRSVLVWDYDFHPAWHLSVRVQERYRSYEPSRAECRTDLRYTRGNFLSTWRLHVSYVQKPGFLTYWEGGFKATVWSLYLRLTGLHIRSWQERIWCYERDAPGNFTVPAYSGTGGAASLYGGWKHRFHRTTLRLNLRAEGLWRIEKPGKTGLKFQLMLER